MYGRERPKLVYRTVFRGEERLRVAVEIGKMRQQKMMWREIGEVFGISPSKAYDILNKTDPDRIQDYIDRMAANASAPTE